MTHSSQNTPHTFLPPCLYLERPFSPSSPIGKFPISVSHHLQGALPDHSWGRQWLCSCLPLTRHWWCWPLSALATEPGVPQDADHTDPLGVQCSSTSLAQSKCSPKHLGVGGTAQGQITVKSTLEPGLLALESQLWTLPLLSWMTLFEILNLSAPQFPPL